MKKYVEIIATSTLDTYFALTRLKIQWFKLNSGFRCKRTLNFLIKVERNLKVLLMTPLARLENKERDRRLEERLKRLEQKQKY